MSKLPELLAGSLPTNQRVIDSLAEEMSCWKKAHAFIRELPSEKKSIQTLMQMLAVEYSGKKRIHILSRLYMRMSRMRWEVESRELMG